MSIKTAMSLSTTSCGLEPDSAHWVWELRTRHVRWTNPSGGPLTAQEEVSTAALLALIHPEDCSRFGQEARRARRTRTPFAVNCRFLLPGEPTRWYSLHGQWQVTPHAPLRLVGLTLVMPEPTVLHPQLL